LIRTSPSPRFAAILAATCLTGCNSGTLVVGPAAAESTAAPIVIDGLFDDWAGLPLAAVDPVGDGGDTGVDPVRVWIANDDRYLFLRLEASGEFQLDENHALTLCIDMDDDPETGEGIRGIGADLWWGLGERAGRAHGPDGSFAITPVDFGFHGAPTVSSTTFEMAIDREAAPAGMSFSGAPLRLVLQDRSVGDSGLIEGDAFPDEGWLTYTFDPTPVGDPESLAIGRTNEDTLRLVTWNTLWDGITDPSREESFRRILAALDPDILALQEVTNHEGVIERIPEFLPLDEGEWHVLGYGNQLTFSRTPFVTEWPLSWDPLHDRITLTPIELPDGRWLVLFNAHLSCCEAEQDRQVQADSFIAYLREITDPANENALPPDTPMVLTGDLNLVQGSQPLTTLLTGDILTEQWYGQDHAPDWDGTPLADQVSRLTERPLAYTWRSDGGSYWPGRLDFVIHTDSVLAVDHAFVLHTGQMSDATLEAHGLRAEDNDTASDHLPHVVDFRVLD